MKRPIFVRELTDDERQALEEGLRSSEAFVLRRAQILLGSARGKWVPRIAGDLSCNAQTVRNAIHAFNDRGLESLQRRPPVPHSTHPAFDAEGLERLREVLHQSPRDYGKEASFWTLTLAAEVSYDLGLTDHVVRYETIRTAMKRLGQRWQRAKRWVESPDPGYARKKGVGTV
ncbi:MAG: helix-turn-helix domain-containing protein [Anaerolineae bacterium]